MEIVCRVCLSTEIEMLPLNESFVTHYNLLTNLSIALFDGMPQYSCTTCMNTVKHFIEFRDRSIASEATLRDIVLGDLKPDTKNIPISFDAENNDKSIIQDDIKKEIKTEIDEEVDSVLDNYDIQYEYESEINNVIEEKVIKPKQRKKRNKKNVTTKSDEIKSLDNIPNDNKWLCGLCPESFDDQNAVKEHLEIHKDTRKCQLCSEKFSCLSQFLAHRLEHLPAKQLKCHICCKRYKSCVYLEYHYKNVHIKGEGSRLECKVCHLFYNKPKALNGHMQTLHSNLVFICDICSKGFANKTNLKSHIAHHNQLKAYVCDLCGASFNYSSGLKDHNIRRHSQKKVYCKNCTRPFSSQQDHDRHKCKDKVRICPVCGIQLLGSSRLSRHMASHSDILKHECKRCPAKFKTKSALIAHIDRHDGNRTKQCEFCPAKFYTAAVLIKHRRTHTGEKPYVCKVCNKGFTGGHNLKVHMKVHGEYLIVKKNSEPDVNNTTKMGTN